jgi:hypothetical protein
LTNRELLLKKTGVGGRVRKKRAHGGCGVRTQLHSLPVVSSLSWRRQRAHHAQHCALVLAWARRRSQRERAQAVSSHTSMCPAARASCRPLVIVGTLVGASSAGLGRDQWEALRVRASSKPWSKASEKNVELIKDYLPWPWGGEWQAATLKRAAWQACSQLREHAVIETGMRHGLDVARREVGTASVLNRPPHIPIRQGGGEGRVRVWQAWHAYSNESGKRYSGKVCQSIVVRWLTLPRDATKSVQVLVRTTTGPKLSFSVALPPPANRPPFAAVPELSPVESPSLSSTHSCKVCSPSVSYRCRG